MVQQRSSSAAPPPKKPPGLLSRLIGNGVALMGWLVFSLLISILIEWLGIALFWREEGSRHSQATLAQDMGYLDARLAQGANRLEQQVYDLAHQAIRWVERFWDRQGWELREAIAQNQKVTNSAQDHPAFASEYREYLLAVPTTIKIFWVRLALLVFSLPAFALFFVIGMVDGLVERDLRRWGGGRESSMVYNLARKSVWRFFIAACVVYLSLPISVPPAWVILPFALALGVSTRVSFERLKKYF